MPEWQTAQKAGASLCASIGAAGRLGGQLCFSPSQLKLFHIDVDALVGKPEFKRRIKEAAETSGMNLTA